MNDDPTKPLLDKQVVSRDDRGRLLPGNTANPNGRPKRATLAELIHAELDNTPNAWKGIVGVVLEKLLKDIQKMDGILLTSLAVQVLLL